MSLNPIPVGDAIAAFIQSNKPTPGTEVTDGQLQAIWEGIVTIIYNDLKSNLGVEPGSFEVIIPPAGTYPGATVPVTGTGGPAN